MNEKNREAANSTVGPRGVNERARRVAQDAANVRTHAGEHEAQKRLEAEIAARV